MTYKAIVVTSDGRATWFQIPSPDAVVCREKIFWVQATNGTFGVFPVDSVRSIVMEMEKELT